MNNATCVDKIGDYECKCQPGFQESFMLPFEFFLKIPIFYVSSEFYVHTSFFFLLLLLHIFKTSLKNGHNSKTKIRANTAARKSPSVHLRRIHAKMAGNAANMFLTTHATVFKVNDIHI